MIAIGTANATIAVASIAALASIITAVLGAQTRRNSEQLKPNGGSSIADSIRRLEKTVDRIEQRVYDHSARLTRIEEHDNH